MENNLLRVVKSRVMHELRYAVQEHQQYRDKVEVYHKFPYKERPMMGIVLRNASSNRIKLSADDRAGTLRSHVALAKAENREAKFLLWAWEDFHSLTKYQVEEDISGQITGSASFGTNRMFTTQRQMLAGNNNTEYADNFRQIEVKKNGEKIFSEYVNGKKKTLLLPAAPVVGDTLTVSYYYSNLTPPGRYYIEMVSSTNFVVDPFYLVEDEEVIDRTTGTEPTAQLDHGGLYGDFDVLYTKKSKHSNKIYLTKGTDYTVDTAGLITFLNALPVDTTLFATYRYVGSRMGPFEVPSEFHYNNTAIPGITLAFSNQLNAGSRMVVIVYKKREPAARVYSGHYQMNFEIDVIARDPQQLADLTDHVIDFLWSERRLALMNEGLTIEELDPAGESEEPYDTNTGDLYYKNSVNLQMMTEWKKFEPFLTEIMDFDTKLYQYIVNKQYILTDQNQFLELRLLPWSEPFEVKYPKLGFARYL